MVTSPLACFVAAIVQRAVILLLLVLHAIFGATLRRHVNNSFNACTALMTELKIVVFGFIFLVRLFSIILDSF
jgi:hypothetical protein